GGELDAPGVIARALVEIADNLVGGELGIDSEVRLADDALVGARVAKGLAAENVRTLGDLDTRDRRGESGREDRGEQEGSLQHGCYLITALTADYGCAPITLEREYRMKYAIFGATGGVGKALAPALSKRSLPFRAVGRSEERLRQEFGSYEPL